MGLSIVAAKGAGQVSLESPTNNGRELKSQFFLCTRSVLEFTLNRWFLVERLMPMAM